MHVVAMTRALGELRSPQDQQPEHYRWTDAGGSLRRRTVFNGGKLQSWDDDAARSRTTARGTGESPSA